MSAVQEHYASEGIAVRVLEAAGAGARPVPPERLYPFDQLHGRELLATRDHVARLAPRPDDHVLDIGSGIGGPARFVAHETGARVTGVDLTQAFVVAAIELSAVAGLAERVRFVAADAADLPFEAGSFDAAMCFYVGMNLPDKPAVLAQAFRVLRPGGRMIWSEVVRTGHAEPVYPLPWAARAGDSHLTDREGLCAMVRDAGFDIVEVADETEAHLDLARARMREGGRPPPAVESLNTVVMGPDFPARRKSYIANLAEGRIASLMLEAVKPG